MPFQSHAESKVIPAVLAGTCTAAAACSFALPGGISPAGCVCPAPLQATQVMTPHPSVTARIWSSMLLHPESSLHAVSLLKELLQKAAPPHKTDCTAESMGQSCSPQTSLLCTVAHASLVSFWGFHGSRRVERNTLPVSLAC